MPGTPPGTPPGTRGGPGPAARPGALGPAIERVFREEYGRAVAVLVRVFGDIDVAEEAVQVLHRHAHADFKGEQAFRNAGTHDGLGHQVAAV